MLATACFCAMRDTYVAEISSDESDPLHLYLVCVPPVVWHDPSLLTAPLLWVVIPSLLLDDELEDLLSKARQGVC